MLRQKKGGRGDGKSKSKRVVIRDASGSQTCEDHGHITLLVNFLSATPPGSGTEMVQSDSKLYCRESELDYNVVNNNLFLYVP